MRMLGDTAIRCNKGCCRVTGKNGKRAERRWIKHSKKENAWKLEASNATAR